MERPTSSESRYSALRYETLMAVIAGSLSPREAASKLDTSESHVREWADAIAARSAAKRRQEMLARQAERRSTVAIALAIATTFGFAVWSAQSGLGEPRPAQVRSADATR